MRITIFPRLLIRRITTATLFCGFYNSINNCIQVANSLSVNRHRLLHSLNSNNHNLLSSHGRKMSLSYDDDEFGDDSFLADFDMDSAIYAHQKELEEEQERSRSSNKRLKRSTELPSSFSTSDDIAHTVSFSSSSSSSPTMADLRAEDDNDLLKEKLRSCLYKYFGHKEFRVGQYEAIRSVIERKADVAVFWSTGSGKSLCYQLPALYLNQVTVVVSPLISLMQDQVHKLNYISNTSACGKNIATFLGSGQQNSFVEEKKCLNFEYNIIYVTPEKLVSTDNDGSFLQQLVTNLGTRICLFAIDESHCVSEWGHDFRPQYNQIGNVLRPQQHFNAATQSTYQQILSKIPIMALTATATKRVQTDIVQSLHLRTTGNQNLLISKQSFDRSNLKIMVKTPRKGLPTVFNDDFLKETYLSGDKKNTAAANINRKQSTIIYTPTRNQAEHLTKYLKARLTSLDNTHNIMQQEPQVQLYHAGLSQDKREEAHMNFLTGKTTIIVATVAFGMGIDKPDTRRIIHYGPPKSVEEYYQQIGRAGRDGYQAECILHASPSDFDSYQSDFYLPSNTPTSRKESYLQSLSAIKSYALRSSTCRRKMLLDFFGETPSFGTHCGTCDVCRNIQKYGQKTTAEDEQYDSNNNMLERDFPEARIVLLTISNTNDQGLSALLPIMAGNTKELYRYNRGVSPEALQSQINELKQNMIETKKKQTNSKRTIKFSKDYWRDLVQPLVEKHYLRESTKSADVNGYKRTWTVYHLSHKGYEALKFPSLPIILPVPESIRESERIEREKREATIQKLTKEYGISKEKLPQEEIDNGDGDVIRSYTKWYGYLDKFKEKDIETTVEEDIIKNSSNTESNNTNNSEKDQVDELVKKKKEERLSHLEMLLSSIENWRSETAVQFSMAPGAVLLEHLVYSIAYTVATMKPGMKLERSALEAVGVRTRGIDSLCQTLGEWVDKVQPTVTTAVSRKQDDSYNAHMVFPSSLGKDDASKAWKYAVYKPNKKTGLAAWENSYIRFTQGESPQAIAMTGGMGGKPIQVQTVCRYILDGLSFGRRNVDLNRLKEFYPPPNKNEWEQLENAANDTGIDVCGDPETSGQNGEKFTMIEFLRPIMGDQFADTPYKDRNEHDRIQFGVWCGHLQWYAALKRIDMEPTFH